MNKKTLSVSAIKDGTVIDHIPIGQALILIRLLRLEEEEKQITVGLHLSSRLMSWKDIIKIQGRFLTEKEAHDIAVFAPKATINIIRNYKVEQKITAQLPEIIRRILICPNHRCITHHEPMDSSFFVEEFKHKIFLRCKYCEKVFEQSEIKEYRA